MTLLIATEEIHPIILAAGNFCLYLPTPVTSGAIRDIKLSAQRLLCRFVAMSIQSSFAGVALPLPVAVPPLRRSVSLIRAKVEPSEKTVEIMRKFSEQYARRSETYFCVDKGVTSVVIKGLADHKETLGAPLCPCRHYDDKAAEAAQGFWNCPCVPMRERKPEHLKIDCPTLKTHPSKKKCEEKLKFKKGKQRTQKAFWADLASDFYEIEAEEEVTNLCLMADDHLDHSDQEENITLDEIKVSTSNL